MANIGSERDDILKKRILILSLILVVIFSFTIPVNAGQTLYQLILSPKTVFVDGKLFKGTPVLNYKGVTYVPIKPFAEALGAKVEGTDKTVNILTKKPISKEVTEKSVEDIAQNVLSMVIIYNYNSEGVLASSGSGFVIDSKGTIVTNYHVIDCASSIIITTNNNVDLYPSSVYNYDKERDIAILSLDASQTFKPLVLGDSAKVKVGDEVVAIGSPKGLQNTVSNGIISAFRNLSGYNYIQISVPISHGSSGGALFNANGEVIGITSAGIEEGQNLNFAIPINDLKPLLKENKVLSLAQVYEKEHIIIYGNGDKYEGDLKNGMRNGKGIYIYASGASYNGEWLNNESDGIGTYTGKDGSKIIGNWIQGKPEGKAIFIDTNNIKHEVEFSNGKVIKLDGKSVN